LIVFIDSAVLNHEMTRSKEKIIQLVNEAVGEPVVEQVFIR
ncbi:MAG: DUF721 domain-containing protein, partial [Phototrophicales bacterium]